MDFTILSTVNACLNSASACLLILGYRFIRRGEREMHKRTMLAACAVSVLFLASYLAYHSQVGSVPFRGQGVLRTVYFAVLISHTVLAATVPVLAFITVRRALGGRLGPHRRLARWTLPIWLYVSVTGVVVYFLLYRM